MNTSHQNTVRNRGGRVIRTTLVLALGVLLGGGLATAGGHRGHHGHHGMMNFEEMDTNQDGMVSKSEAEAWRANRQVGLDADGNGAVSFEEARAHRRAMAELRARERYQRLDADGDGQVSLTEFNARGAAMFDRFDKNADGVISADERPQRGEGRGYRRGKMESRGQ